MLSSAGALACGRAGDSCSALAQPTVHGTLAGGRQQVSRWSGRWSGSGSAAHWKQRWCSSARSGHTTSAWQCTTCSQSTVLNEKRGCGGRVAAGNAVTAAAANRPPACISSCAQVPGLFGLAARQCSRVPPASPHFLQWGGQEGAWWPSSLEGALSAVPLHAAQPQVGLTAANESWDAKHRRPTCLLHRSCCSADSAGLLEKGHML